MLSVTQMPLSDLVLFFKDFENLDTTLHLRTFVPIEEVKANPKSKYYKALEEAALFKKQLEEMVPWYSMISPSDESTDC